MSLARNIKDRALFEGFNKVGIVGAQSLADEGRRLKEWLARGYHGEMGWMARDVEKRINPREIFPQARSVVVVALNYFTPHQHQQNPATGKVSRYAWGDDYHDVVKDETHVAAFVDSRAGAASRRKSVCRYSADDGQSVGRARRARLAWQTLKRDHAGAWFVGVHRRAAAESGVGPRHGAC